MTPSVYWQGWCERCPASQYTYPPTSIWSLTTTSLWLAFTPSGHLSFIVVLGVLPRCSLHHLTFYNEQTCICIPGWREGWTSSRTTLHTTVGVLGGQSGVCVQKLQDTVETDSQTCFLPGTQSFHQNTRQKHQQIPFVFYDFFDWNK